MSGKLTSLAIERVYRNRSAAMKGDGHGLYFRMQTGQRATWTFRYRWVGRDRWMALGSYPDMSLSDARKEARLARVKLDKGIDPLEDRRLSRNQQKLRGSFSQLAEDWYSSEVEGRLEHTGVPRRHLNKYLLPALGRMRADEITPADIARLLDRIKVKAPTSANDTLRFAKRIFAF